MPLLAILAGIGVLLEILMVPLWWRTESLRLMFLLHGVASGLCVMTFLRMRNISEGPSELDPALFYALLFLIFFPALGWIAALCIVVGFLFLRRRFKSDLYDAFESYLEEKGEGGEGLALWSNALRRIRSEVNFEPFVDILMGKDVETKVKVIEKLAQNVSRENVRLLKEAIQDPAAEVRLFTAGALLKIEDQLQGQIELAEKMARQRGRARDYADLGNLYRAYASTGLMEERLADHYYVLAADAYRQSLDVDTHQPEVIQHYAESLMATRDYGRAKLLLDHASSLWSDHHRLCFLRAQVYFRLGHLREIEEILKGMKPNQVEEHREVLEFWTQTA